MSEPISTDGGYVWLTPDSDTPFRTPTKTPPYLKKEEFEKKTREQHDARVEILDLSDSDHLERYRQIMQKVAVGWAIISVEERQFIPETQNWKIFIRYLERFQELTSTVLERVRTDDHGQITFT